MPKATGLPSLNLSASKNNDDLHGLSPATMSPRSLTSPLTPRSIPGSPIQSSTFIPALTHQVITVSVSDDDNRNGNGPASPPITAVPDIPTSPARISPKHGRDASKSFFSNLMASKSSHKLHLSDTGVADPNDRASARSRTSSKDRSLHSVRRQESTPDLPKLYHSNSNNASGTNDISTNAVTADFAQTSMTHKKAKSKLGGILTRNKPSKSEEPTSNRKGHPPPQLNLEGQTMQAERIEPSPKTAPIKSDHREKAFGNENGHLTRNRSADRHHNSESGQKKDRSASNLTPSHSLKEGQNSGLLSNFHHGGKGMGDRLGKAGKGFFGKITRSGSNTEKETVTDDTYVCTTINLPLVRQTRKTRIARKLEKSKDKTEFWMPALPWRCIDYLNMNGCEEEGLYRVPGSGRDVKRWQRRFDTEYDINLFDEEELYDINTIGSMFKSWLRELPDEIMPKSVQNKIAAECAGATKTPQLLKDELSKLPPFNYYLLFAITCHLSLLNSFADKNKMDYRNLCICFQPCLKIDAFCFQFLVMDWKACWQGCWTEKEYLEEEYRYEREGSIHESEDLAVDDRAISSSGSSQHVPNNGSTQVPNPPKTADASQQRKVSAPLKPKQRSLSTSTGNRVASNSSHTPAASMPAVPRLTRTPEPQPSEQLPELSNISPIRM